MVFVGEFRSNLLLTFTDVFNKVLYNMYEKAYQEWEARDIGLDPGRHYLHRAGVANLFVH